MKRWLEAAVAGWFPGIVLLGCIPASMYVQNQEVLGRDWKALLPFLVLVGVWGVAAGVAAARGAPRLATAGLLLGWGVLLRDVLTPLRSTGLVGLNTVTIDEPPTQAALEAGVFLGVALLGWRVSGERLRRALLPLALAFLVIEASFLLYQFVANAGPKPVAAPALVQAGAPRTAASGRGNVYLICLDSFLGTSLPDALRVLEDEEALSGFVYYPNHRSSYTFTWPSIATALGGGRHRGGPMRDWVEDHRQRTGLLHDAATAGFELWEYEGAEGRHQDVADARYFPRPKVVSNANREAYSLLAAWLTRVAPVFAREETWQYLTQSRSPYFLSVSNLIVGSQRQLELMTAHEASRPTRGQFVFAHFYLPHEPFAFDEHCRELTAEGTYLPQAVCALRSLRTWLRVVRDRGAFEDATIIVFSDHGLLAPSAASYLRAQKERWSALPKDARLWGKVPLWGLSDALLLLKAPRAPVQPVRTDPRLTSTVDIPATLASLHQWALPEEGASLLAPPVPGRRVEVTDGFAALYEKIKKRSSELERVEGNLERWSFSVEEGWRSEGTVDVSW